jgi:SecY interacting protein Syd
MSEQVFQALEKFILKYQDGALIHTQMLQVEYDPLWPSDCYEKITEVGEIVHWQPVKRHNEDNFDGIQNALDLKIHPDVVSFYSRFWSGNLSAKTIEGNLQLLQPWNQADFERLQQNLVGHVLMKRRLKQPETLFFALTDEDDFILSVDNSSGEVMLEQVGLVPEKVIAPNLSHFLDSLEPTPSSESLS